MRKERIVLDFKRLPVVEKIAFARNVINEMSENPLFATPDIPLAQLKTTTDTMEARSMAAQNGGKEETLLLRQTEEVWDDQMTKEARYVERIADGNGVVILSAGFNLVKPAVSPQRPEFGVELGEKSGSVLLRRQTIPGAKSYIWQHCMHALPEHELGWITAEVTTRSTVEITGLTPLTKYWFRVAVVTAQGTSAFSNPVVQAVL